MPVSLIYLDLCPPPQVARQSQLQRGVFPVLYHPLPAPVWADDVDGRVNFGMDIGESTHPNPPPPPLLFPLVTEIEPSPSGKARGFFNAGDMVIVVTGWIPGSRHTNIMRAVSVP